MSWQRHFDDPLVLPNGNKLQTLAEAAHYIMLLPKRERDATHWQIAGEMLIVVAEGRGPLMFAEIGMKKAMHFGKDTPKVERRRRAKRYNIVG